MPQLTIDGRRMDVPAGTTILDAAAAAGIEIPTLCFLREFEPSTSCLVCMVKLPHTNRYVPACATAAAEGMVVESQTDEVRGVRRTALELLFSDHVGDCLAPCHFACPAHMDVPGMLRQIAASDLPAAIATVKRDIALPAILGRVCPKPCEKGCRRQGLDGAVAVCQLKRFVADADLDTAAPFSPVRAAATGKRVAIVGAGPCGLSAAYYLAQHGHACTVFEATDRPGGRLWTESTADELPRDVLRREVATLLIDGVDLQTGVPIGTERSLDSLCGEFDAVVLAIGHAALSSAPAWGIRCGAKGIDIDRHTWQTNRPGVFAAGNALRAKGLVVRSAADGREVAEAVHGWLSGTLPAAGRLFSSRVGKLSDDELRTAAACAGATPRHEPAGNASFDARAAVEQAERCLHCDCRSLDICKLRRYAVEYDVDPNRYPRTRKPLVIHSQHADVLFEPGKCIQCGLCVQIAAAAGEPLGLTFIGRGFDVRIGVPFDRPLEEGLRQVAAACVAACPTAAIAFKKKPPPGSLPIVGQ